MNELVLDSEGGGGNNLACSFVCSFEWHQRHALLRKDELRSALDITFNHHYTAVWLLGGEDTEQLCIEEGQ